MKPLNFFYKSVIYEIFLIHLTDILIYLAVCIYKSTHEFYFDFTTKLKNVKNPVPYEIYFLLKRTKKSNNPIFLLG